MTTPHGHLVQSQHQHQPQPRPHPHHQLPPPHPYPHASQQRPQPSMTLPQPHLTPSRHSSSSTLPTINTIAIAASAGPAPPPKKAKQKRSSFSDHTALESPNDLTKVRAYAACRNCRAKKIKCLPGPPTSSQGQQTPDGQLVPGSCQQCTQAGVECTYSPTRDRAAYSRQYVQNLEARVQALEALQTRVLPLLEVFERTRDGTIPMMLDRGKEEEHAQVPSRALLAGDIHVNVTESEGEGEGEGEEDEAIQGSDAEDGGQMTQDERGNYRYIGSSNTLSLLDSFSHRDRDREREREKEREGDIDNPRIGLPMTRRPSSTQRFSAHPSDPNSRQSPAISDHNARGPNPYFGPVAGSGVVKALPPIQEVQFPSPQRAAEMIDAYFTEVHPCLPIVLEHDFRREYKQLMDASVSGFAASHASFMAMLFAVFALGERVLIVSQAWQRERQKLQDSFDHSEEETVYPGEAEAGVIWYERAQILHFTALKDINIHQVQCLTLMAAFQASVNAMPASWLLAGQALRVAQDLGLHRSTSRLPLSFAEKQLRSRCWWAIYGLERMMSIALGRPLGVDDLDIDVALPAEIDDEGLEKLSRDGTPTSLTGAGAGTEEPVGSTMSGFIALTKLCKIAGRVVHLLYRPANEKSVSDPSWAASQQTSINKLDKTLRDWLDNDVPLKYKESSTDRSVALVSAILSNSYFAILITLHRNFLPSNPDYPRPKPPPSSQSLSRCVDAARSVIHIASQTRTQVPSSHHLAVYCQYLWSSAVILLLCEVQARDQVVIEAVGSHVESCRRSLQALEPVWPGSRKLKELLVDVANRAKEVATVTSKAPIKVGKKRKATVFDVKTGQQPQVPGQMRPPPSRHQSHSASPTRPGQVTPIAPGDWQSASASSYAVSAGGNPEKRQRVYETSDTRTMIVPEEVPMPQHQIQSTYYNLPAYHSATPTPGSTRGSVVAPDASNQGALESEGVYDTFDLGGVTFNPSELLQGFGDSASAFWNNMTFMGDPSYTSTTAPGSGGNTATGTGQGHAFSGHNTPNSATGSGPSPIPQQAQTQASHLTPQPGSAPATASIPSSGPTPTPTQQTHGHGHGVYTPTPQPGSGAEDPLSEFWAQIAGSSFDWQADPSVPFNI